MVMIWSCIQSRYITFFTFLQRGGVWRRGTRQQLVYQDQQRNFSALGSGFELEKIAERKRVSEKLRKNENGKLFPVQNGPNNRLRSSSLPPKIGCCTSEVRFFLIWFDMFQKCVHAENVFSKNNQDYRLYWKKSHFLHLFAYCWYIMGWIQKPIFNQSRESKTVML